MDTLAIIFESPGTLGMKRLELAPAGDEDVVVEVTWSAISTGTERLLWTGRMPEFPGLGYPLVPGYETVGRVVSAGSRSGRAVGDRVFVPGANCYGAVRGLFGGAASRIVLPGRRTQINAAATEEHGTLLALAATACHAIAGAAAEAAGRSDNFRFPDLIIGHGVVGRLIARLTLALGGVAPTVWEVNATRRAGASGYGVIDPATDMRRDYRRIIDASGDSDLLDGLIGRLARGGEIVLAGFYDKRLNFAFPPAFMREISLRVAAEWTPPDLAVVTSLLASGQLQLDGLITHHFSAAAAPAAYQTAFSDPSCIKMVLDWSSVS